MLQLSVALLQIDDQRCIGQSIIKVKKAVNARGACVSSTDFDSIRVHLKMPLHQLGRQFGQRIKQRTAAGDGNAREVSDARLWISREPCKL
jgi:hypothetical protein